MTAQKEKIARFKLSQHRQAGTKSKLNIFEVAQLMDQIHFSTKVKEAQKPSIFQGVNPN